MEFNNIKVERGNPLIPGVTVLGDCVNFTLMATPKSQCEVIFYQKGKTEEVVKISFHTSYVTGNVWTMKIKGLRYKEYDYNFCVDGEILVDPYAKAITGKEIWGKVPASIKGVIVCGDFDWKNDSPLRIPFNETILYRLHIRGFTKHSSSKVKHKGTYLGIVEKIPYFKKLGITMVEAMPAYEFHEVKPQKEPVTSMQGQFQIAHSTLNYWGYTDGYVFAPKAAYAFSKEEGGQVNEFKHMVQQLHRNGIEVSMEFFFPEGTNPALILDALHYWVMEYHIDGIHIHCGEPVLQMIRTDNLLSTTKIFTNGFKRNMDFYGNQKVYGNIAEFCDDFMICARKFLKGDEDMLRDIAHRIQLNPVGAPIVNYIANHNTFTLYDNVSYSKKYNEENGENNNDGAVYNYSWNCGEEGDTRKRTVMELRKRQIKNALCMIFLSQGIPMLYAGDEMCNSQKGNNNPYCLDNEISWTIWNTTAIAKEIQDFVIQLIRFRKQHQVLHLQQELRQMDYKSYGFPDVSFHGTKAWYADFSYFNRHFSVMYCGQYAYEKNQSTDADIIVAYNMFWESVPFGIPVAKEGKQWRCVFTTGRKREVTDINADRIYTAFPRSITVFVAE